jgi:hypothetical protein
VSGSEPPAARATRRRAAGNGKRRGSRSPRAAADSIAYGFTTLAVTVLALAVERHDGVQADGSPTGQARLAIIVRAAFVATAGVAVAAADRHEAGQCDGSATGHAAFCATRFFACFGA